MMKFRYVLNIALSLFMAGCSSVGSILATPTPTPVPTPTQTPEQIYISQIQPAVEQLMAWVNGPLAEYEAALYLPVNQDGTVAKSASGDTTTLLEALIIMWEYPSLAPMMYEGWDKALKEYVAPAAERASQTGFEVLGTFKAMTPPASVSAAHEQIVACVQYKVELTAEVKNSITGTYFTPKTFDAKDPCNLLEASIQSLSNFVDKHK